MTWPKRPLIRYHGGKWRLAPCILQHLQPHRCYVEPFGGAADVLLQKPRAAAATDCPKAASYAALLDGWERARGKAGVFRSDDPLLAAWAEADMNRRSAYGAFSGTSTASSGAGWWGCSGDADSAPQSADFSNEQVRCAACQHFTLREVPKYAELGLGHCVGMVDRPGTFVSPTYPRKCHQYQPAPQAKAAARIEWLRDLRGEEP